MNALTEKLKGRTPKTAIILAPASDPSRRRWESAGHSVYGPSRLPVPKISGHAGKLFLVGRCAGCQESGGARRPRHPYESGNAAVMRPAIEMLKGAGIETLILTNAAGA